MNMFQRSYFVSITRACSLALGGFTLINLFRDGFHAASALDINLWWIDLRSLPVLVQLPLIWSAALLQIAFGLRRQLPRILRHALAAVCILLLAVVAANITTFYSLLGRNAFDSKFPLPLSAFIAVILVTILARAHASRRPPRASMPVMATTLLALFALFPLAQIACFGATDYRRPADAIVVFGARAYADGQPSTALADRVSTACDLYHRGLAPRIIFSGGPGDGAVHETESMRRFAIHLGVPNRAIDVDEHGLNTRATAEQTSHFFATSNIHRVLAVSHAYHLPRVKLAYQRAGYDVLTVPAHEQYFLTQMPYLVAREVAAFWAYWLRG